MYQFIHENDDVRLELTLKHEDQDMFILLDQFKYFLQGCSFSIDGEFTYEKEDK